MAAGCFHVSRSERLNVEIRKVSFFHPRGVKFTLKNQKYLEKLNEK